MTISKAIDKIHEVIRSPTASFWIKDNLQRALAVDVVERAYEAALLAKLLGDYGADIAAKRASAESHRDGN